MTWIFASRGTVTRNEEWRDLGTTEREPSAELVRELCQRGAVPRTEADFYSDEGMEFRFLPVNGGDPVIFRARYELEVVTVTIEEAEAAAAVARLPSLDPEPDDDLTTQP